MRLDFNVLWVEDQQSAVQAQRERIEFLIGKEGFRLQTLFAKSVDEATQYLSNEIYGDHIDLVLMDYDLGAGGRGDDGLREVRNIFPYKDIVFYSAQAPDLQDKVEKKHLQGIFCSTRDGLPDTVDGLFDSLVKKVLDIDHSRGIVMGATSDIDHFVNDCLIAAIDNGSDDRKKEAFQIVDGHLASKRKYFDKNIQAASEVRTVSGLKDFHSIYTSNDKLQLLRAVLSKLEDKAEDVDAIAKYQRDTVPKRNDLAHLRVRVTGFSRKLYDRNDKELTSTEMRALRKELMDFQDIIERLKQKI